MDYEHIMAVQRLYDTTEAGAAINELMKKNRALSEALNDIVALHSVDITTPGLLTAAASALIMPPSTK